MGLDVTIEAFLDVLARYNRDVWPMQVAAYVMAAAALWLVARRRPTAGGAVCAILAFFWLWVGLIYHGFYLSRMHATAFLSGGLFVAQGMVFLSLILVRPNLAFRFKADLISFVAALFIVYAMVLHPILALLQGRGMARGQSLGLTPCTTVILTFGLLLLARRRVPRYVLVAPFVWTIIGFSGALNLGIREDIGLLATGIPSTVVLFQRQVRRTRNGGGLLGFGAQYDIQAAVEQDAA